MKTSGLRSSLLLFYILTIAALAAAQAADETVAKAAARSQVYLETFKNLLSEETKTFEIYDKKGGIKKQRKVVSTFLVYQASTGDGDVTEFRNVIAVDGKKLLNTDDRAKDFFEKVASAGSSQKELERIRDESTRYDEDFSISGLTLFQAIALNASLRNSFKFTVAGREAIGGIETIVLAYEQTSPNGSITVNGTGSDNYDIEIDGGKTTLDPRIRGKLWLDAQNFNLRREVRERTIRPEGFEAPVVVAEDVFDFTNSDFGILTPSRIVHLQYMVKVDERETRKDTRVEFIYGKFTKPDVEVRSSEVKSNN